MKKALSLFGSVSLIAATAYAVGSQRVLDRTETTIAEALLNNQVRIAEALDAAGVQGPVQVSAGTAFQGGMPSLQTQGYNLSLCRPTPGLPGCAALGTLTLSADTDGSGHTTINVRFIR